MIRPGLIALVLGLFGNHYAFAELILNGSFESPGFAHSNAENYRYLADNGDTSITGWTITRPQDVGERVYWFHSSRYPVFHGEFAVYLSDAGKASTSVTVEANKQYSFSFNAIVSPKTELNVVIGNISKTLSELEASDSGVPGWVRYKLAFTPTVSGTQQVELINEPDRIEEFAGGVSIDGVSITAVPEPSSCVTVLLAGMLMLARRRTRGRHR